MERATIQRDDAQVVDEAEAAGIHREHLPGEHGRRIRAAQKAERERVNEVINAPMRRREAAAKR